MVCDEKRKHLDVYQQATRKYSDAVAELGRMIGVSTKDDYQALYRMTEAMRVDAAEAKEQLERHVTDHHC